MAPVPDPTTKSASMFSVPSSRSPLRWKRSIVAKALPTSLSGPTIPTPALGELVAAAAVGDNVVVTRLDRLGRSLPHLLGLVEDLAAAGVGLRSLGEEIDTSSATGRLVLHVFGALAEFERGLMRGRWPASSQRGSMRRSARHDPASSCRTRRSSGFRLHVRSPTR